LKKPEDRYASAAEFAAALKPFSETSRGYTSMMPVRRDVADTSGPPPATRSSGLAAATLPIGVPSRARRAGVGLIVGVAAACLLMGVVLAMAVMRLLH
jgi:hypothetical protein